MTSISAQPIIINAKQDNKSNIGKVVGGMASGGAGLIYLNNNSSEFFTSAAEKINYAYRHIHEKTKCMDIKKGSIEVAEWANKNKEIVQDCIKSAKIQNIASGAGLVALCVATGLAAGEVVDSIANHFKKKS